MSPSVFRKNSAFESSMNMLPASLEALAAADRARILSLHPLADQSVSPKDTFIEGAKAGTMPVIGHMAGIAYGLTLAAPRISRFLKSQTH
jgi:hypothetical protein